MQYDDEYVPSLSDEDESSSSAHLSVVHEIQPPSHMSKCLPLNMSEANMHILVVYHSGRSIFLGAGAFIATL